MHKLKSRRIWRIWQQCLKKVILTVPDQTVTIRLSLLVEAHFLTLNDNNNSNLHMSRELRCLFSLWTRSSTRSTISVRILTLSRTSSLKTDKQTIFNRRSTAVATLKTMSVLAVVLSCRAYKEELTRRVWRPSSSWKTWNSWMLILGTRRLLDWTSVT